MIEAKIGDKIYKAYLCHKSVHYENNEQKLASDEFYRDPSNNTRL